MAFVVQDLPLLDLFTKLREGGVPLGIEEYELLLVALQSGCGLPDQAALKRLCRTLWIKSRDDEDARLFESIFDKVMTLPIKKCLIETPKPRIQPSERDSRADEVAKGDDIEEPIADDSGEPEPAPAVNEVDEVDEVDEVNEVNEVNEPEDSSEPSAATDLPEFALEMRDEVQASLAVIETITEDEEIPDNRFIMSGEYSPVTQRQMKQVWRYLRRPMREGPATELDIEATVNEVARTGVFLAPTLVPRRVNQAELLLLIDRDGSMVPFHALSHRLEEAALRGGRLGWASVYYFHNCPVEVFYHDPYHVEAEPIPDALQHLHTKQAVALIFSDAGAARRGFNRERLRLTETFIEQLKKHVRYIAWLNPVPRHRWRGTTASRIARFVPMFPIGRQGFHDAIDALRGRPK